MLLLQWVINCDCHSMCKKDCEEWEKDAMMPKLTNTCLSAVNAVCGLANELSEAAHQFHSYHVCADYRRRPPALLCRQKLRQQLPNQMAGLLSPCLKGQKIICHFVIFANQHSLHQSPGCCCHGRRGSNGAGGAAAQRQGQLIHPLLPLDLSQRSILA